MEAYEASKVSNPDAAHSVMHQRQYVLTPMRFPVPPARKTTLTDLSAT